MVAAYIEELTGKLAPASVKQHLAALQMLFDWLFVGQVLPFNPASSVRGPKHVIKHPCLKSSPNCADSQLTGVCVQQVIHKYSTAYPHDGIADLGAFGAHLRPSRSSTFAKIMSFRMMATMATLCRLPLAINRSYSAAMSWFHR